MLPFDEQFTEPVIGATAAKAHFVRIADLGAQYNEGPVSISAPQNNCPLTAQI